MLILYLKTAHHFVSISPKSKSNHKPTEQNALANRAFTCLPILLCVLLGEGGVGCHYWWDLVSPCYRKRPCKPNYGIPLVSPYIQTFSSTITT